MFRWFKRKTPQDTTRTPTLPPSPQPATSTTSIDKPDFAIELPFKWTEVPCEEGFEFHNETLPEQFIVNVLHARTKTAPDEMSTVLQTLVQVRRDAVERLSDGNVQLTDTKFNEGDRQMEARFHGRDKSNDIQLAVAIRATPTKFVTMSLYRYTLQEIGLPLSEYAELVFDLAQVKNT